MKHSLPGIHICQAIVFNGYSMAKKKKQLIQKCNDVISRAIGDLDVVGTTTPETDLKKYRYDTAETRFKGFLDALNLELLSDYIDDKTAVALHCKTCGHKWKIKPYLIKRRKQCPRCGKELEAAGQTAELWERSAKIIKDKGGKLLLQPTFDPGRPASIKDEFVIICSKGHHFTTSHYKLRKDVWCPICPQTSKVDRLLQSIRTSNHVYGQKMSKEERQRHLGMVAAQKGADLISIKQKDSKYIIQCQKCKIRNRITEQQILKNRYLCSNKCTRGEKYNLKDVFFEHL